VKNEVEEKYNTYSPDVRSKLLEIRELVISVVKEENITGFEEALKWGEISFLAKKGSTFRVDAPASMPGKLAVYFHCQSLLVETFRQVFGERFVYEENRAIILEQEKPLPEAELKVCFRTALNYHKLKNKYLLGLGE